jgi:hypothetical protein
LKLKNWKIFNTIIIIKKGFLMFTKRLAFLCTLILAIIIWSCTDTNNNTNTTTKENLKPVPTVTTNPCAKEFKLWAGKTMDAGTVTISNDANYLYITYNFKSPWLAGAGNMHVWLGKTAPTGKGSPGQYPFASTNTGYVSSYTFVIKKVDYPQYFNPDGSFYFMTHASVVQLVNGQYINGNTAYSETLVDDNPWYGFGKYIWCTDYPPEHPKDYCLCQNESGWGGDKANDFGGEYWGLYIPYSGTDITSPLWANSTTSVGTVKVSKNGSGYIVVTYNITEADWTIGAYHFDLSSSLEGIPHCHFNGDLIHQNPVPGWFTYKKQWYDLSNIIVYDNGTPELCDDIYIHCCDCFEVQVYYKENEQKTVEVTTNYQYSSGTVFVAAQAQLHRWCEK